MATLELPWPPSMNHYWRNVGPCTKISRDGRTFRSNVCALLAGADPASPQWEGGLRWRWMPSRLTDADETWTIFKNPPWMRCKHAGVYMDDSQIDLLLNATAKGRSRRPAGDHGDGYAAAALPRYAARPCARSTNR